jgi:hypothetical protein
MATEIKFMTKKADFTCLEYIGDSDMMKISNTKPNKEFIHL